MGPVPRSMTDWRAVGYGFAVMLIAGLLATGAPGLGHAAAGLIGGFVAGMALIPLFRWRQVPLFR